MNAIDTNVLIYALDADVPVKQQQAIELIDRLRSNPNETVLPWQVVTEYLAGLRRWSRLGRIAPGAVSGHLQDLLQIFPIALPTPEILTRSLELSATFSLSHWDSLLVAACQFAGAAELYSEDMQSGVSYGSVTIVNPFV